MTRNNNHLNLVSCGQPLPGIDVRIVDPDSHRPLGENTIGEIWIDGESKCAGYWERPELTDAIFHARIEGDSRDSRPYLRTGATLASGTKGNSSSVAGSKRRP